MKILCLIIDAVPHECWQETYRVHRLAWERCLARSPSIEGYFLYSDPSLNSDYTIEGNRFTVRGQERHSTILHKTRKALEVLLTDHDYVIRTNTSTLYDFPLLMQQALPREGLYMGLLIEGRYVTGSGMVLSRDVARKLLEPYPDDLIPWDDAAIGHILGTHGIQPISRGTFVYDYSKPLDQIPFGAYFCYRLRDYNDPQRVKEREITEHICNRICNE